MVSLVFLIMIVSLFSYFNGINCRELGNKSGHVQHSINVSCNEFQFIKSFFNTFNITLNEATVYYCKNLSVTNLTPHSKMTNLYYVNFHNTLESIVDLMLYWKRFEGSFLVDEYSGIKMESALGFLRANQITADLHFVNHERDVDSVLRHLEFFYGNIVVICMENITNYIIKIARLLHLFSTNHTWIIVSKQLPVEIFGVDITPDSQVTMISPNEIMKINDARNFNIHPNTPHVKLNISKWIPACSFVECFRLNLDINILEKYKFSFLLASTHHFDIYDVFYVPDTNRTELVMFGQWNVMKRLQMLPRLDQTNSEQRLGGRRMRLVEFEHEPYTFHKRTDDNKLIITGYLKEVVDMIMATLNIRYSIKEVEQVFGIGINGTYTGFIGRLYQREADMAMNVLAMTSSRASAVRYAGPVTKAHLAIIYNKPHFTIQPITYLLPFSLVVWLCTVVTVVVTIILLAIAHLFGHCSENCQDILEQQHYHSACFRILSLTFVIQELSQPTGSSVKILYGTLLIATIVTFAYYTSVFTSFLAHQEDNLPFKNMEDVAASSDAYTLLIVKNTRHEDTFKFATSGPFAKIWERIVKQGNISFGQNAVSGFEKMQSGNYLLLSDGTTMSFINANNCSVVFAPIKFAKEYYYVVHRIDFPYTTFFTLALLDLLEGGILIRLAIVYNLENHPSCGIGNKSVSFGIEQVVGIFFILKIGIVLSIICLLIEKQIYNFKHWRRAKYHNETIR